MVGNFALFCNVTSTRSRTTGRPVEQACAGLLAADIVLELLHRCAMAADRLLCFAKVSVGHSSERTMNTTVCLPWTEPLSRSTTLRKRRKRHRRQSRCGQLPCSPVMSWPCSRDRGCPLHGNVPVDCRLRLHMCNAQRADVTARRQHYLSHGVEIPMIKATTAAAGQLLRMVTLGGGCSG